MVSIKSELFKKRFAKVRVHLFRVTPYFSYAMMGITYLNTIFIVLMTTQNELLKIAEIVITFMLFVAFVFMYRLDDKEDLIGIEYDYIFKRSRPLKEMLKILRQLEEDKKLKKECKLDKMDTKDS